MQYLWIYLSGNALEYVFWIAYALSAIGAVIVVVSENRNPVKSLAWISVLFLLPIIGFLLYVVFGRSLRNKRMISRHNRRKLRRKESFRRVKIDKLDLQKSSKMLIQLSRNLCSAIFYPGNNIEFFTDGKSKFKSLLADIHQAKHYINLQYYIVSDDHIGKKLAEALKAKARAGVKVRINYDSVGSYSTSNKFFKDLKEAGVEAYPFFKVSFPFMGSRINWRNHRKMVVIDGKVAYIGGMNVADRYIDGGKNFKSWRDTHARIEGPAVGAIMYSFAVDWSIMGRPLIDDEVVADKGEEHDAEGAGVQLLTSGPTSQWNNMSLLFVKAIGQAKKRVWLQTPYFLPTSGLLNALQSAALSGIDVRLMLPLKSDSRMLDFASFSYITECLQAGIKIYLYEAGMLHAKMILIDDEFVSMGSTNFDFRSFEHNFEANINIYSVKYNSRMADIYLHDQKQSRRVELSTWKKRPWWYKMRESTMRLLSPIL